MDTSNTDNIAQAETVNNSIDSNKKSDQNVQPPNDGKNTTTLITALYNIGRDKLTGKCAYRSFTKYLNWFKHVLSINVPMVIFISEELQSYVLTHRPRDYPTKIIIRKFEDLAAYKYHDRIQTVINTMVKSPNPDGKIPQHFSECPEFITAKYETIIYSKFDFLHEVATENPYNTKYFIWLDAGTFYQEPPFDTTLPWPDPYKMQILGDKFLISDHNFNIYDTSPLKDKRSYLRLNRNEICAFILGGTKVAIDQVYTQFWNEVENALGMGVINNEQHILQLMALEHPDHYYSWYRTRYQYGKLPVPLRDRMIPCELAFGTYVGENYAVNPNIKLLTVATKEVPKSSYERWEITARHYGYNYEILGQQDCWQGFGTKIKIYYQRLRSVTEPYTVLTDCTDLFFCGSSSELYDKFIQTGKDIIIGGELEVWYKKGKHNKNTIKTFFNKIKESPQAYPNSGFIMGKTENIRELMGLQLNYEDDQAACFDAIYENKLALTIDYKTSLIGNIPNYKDQNLKSSDYFKFDPKINRYRNVHNDEIPVVFHFSGKNWYAMQEFYATSQPELVAHQSATANTGWIGLGIIILVMVLLITAYLGSKYMNTTMSDIR